MCPIEDIALHGLDLAGNHGGAGFDAIENDLSRLVGV